MGREHAVTGIKRRTLDAFDQLFRAPAISDQIGNGDEQQPMLLRKRDEIGQAHHGAVVVNDFADRTSGG